MPFGIDLNNVYEQATQFADDVADVVEDVAEDVADVVEDVASDPIGFVSDTAEAVGDGVKHFARNTARHTVGATTEWLGNNLEDAGIDLPDEFSARSMFEVGLDVLGKTKERLIEKTEDVLGEKNFETAKAVASKIIDIVAEGTRNPISSTSKIIAKVADRLADLPEQLAISDKLEFAKDVVDKVTEMANPVDTFVAILDAKNQMVDAVLKMMNAMFESQQRVMEASAKRSS